LWMDCYANHSKGEVWDNFAQLDTSTLRGST
jgi:hypothetical protein